MNFLDIKTDFAFKIVFGSEGSKDLLISFLNSVIEFDQQQTNALIKKGLRHNDLALFYISRLIDRYL